MGWPVHHCPRPGTTSEAAAACSGVGEGSAVFAGREKGEAEASCRSAPAPRAGTGEAGAESRTAGMPRVLSGALAQAVETSVARRRSWADADMIESERYLPAMQELVVIVVGDEILQGRRTEANAAWIARRAADLGVYLSEVRIVSDAPGSLRDAVRAFRGRSVEIVVTGGLGPTRDDRTRGEIAEAFGSVLEEHPQARRAVEESYARRRLAMDPKALVQALLPTGSVMVPNPTGTAPGFRMEDAGLGVTALPGVPREMRAMWEETLEPRLRDMASRPGISRLFTHGLGESDQEARMADLPLVGVEFCSLPGPWGVELQCRVSEGDPASRQERADAAREEVSKRLGDALVLPLGATLLESLVAGLRSRGWQVALGESCTAGLAAAKLADLPGVSDVLAGGVVAYSNALKVDLLGVSPETLSRHGAVSQETALEMARGARRVLSRDGIGLGVTGIAGPEGGTPDKPVGTVWIALSGPLGERSEKLQLVGTRDLIRERSAWKLLGLAWSELRRA